MLLYVKYILTFYSFQLQRSWLASERGIVGMVRQVLIFLQHIYVWKRPMHVYAHTHCLSLWICCVSISHWMPTESHSWYAQQLANKCTPTDFVGVINLSVVAVWRVTVDTVFITEAFVCSFKGLVVDLEDGNLVKLAEDGTVLRYAPAARTFVVTGLESEMIASLCSCLLSD